MPRFGCCSGECWGNAQTTSYLLVGNAVLAGPSATCWTIASSTWDRWDGTYPLQVIAPSSLSPASAGRAFIWPLNGIVTSWIVFAILGLGFDLAFTAQALLLVPGLVVLVPGLVVLICLSCYGFCLFIGGFVAMAPRLRIMINFGTTNALMALTGVSVPISFWPRWLSMLAQALPVTHGLEAVRLAFTSGSLGQIARCAGLELLVGLTWSALSLLVVDRLGRAWASRRFDRFRGLKVRENTHAGRLKLAILGASTSPQARVRRRTR